jgi:threonylcarbamoyladenosine tRNA methylthiotransferase MtaB
MKGQVKDEIKKARSERLLALNDIHARAFRQQFLGVEMDVLIEGRKHGRWEGLTDNYLRVELDETTAALVAQEETGAGAEGWQNRLVRVRLESLVEDGILGTLLAWSEKVTG